MGFFYTGILPKSNKQGPLSDEALRMAGCKVCPFSRKTKSTRVKPRGAKSPLIYVLTMHPLMDEIKNFFRVAEIDSREVRWGSVMQCSGSCSDKEEIVAIEACYTYVAADIEKTQPTLVIAVGDAYKWFLKGQKGALWQWAGRLIPVLVKDHSCWLLPIEDPATLSERRSADDDLHMLGIRLREALKELAEAGLPEAPTPPPQTAEEVFSGIRVFTEGTEMQAKQVVAWLKKNQGKRLGFDIETAAVPCYPESPSTAFRPQAPDARILTAAVSAGINDTIAFPLFWGKTGKWQKESYRKMVEATMIEALANSSSVVVHNASFEVSWISFFYGDDLRRAIQWDDTMAQAYALDERKGMSSLDVLCRQHLGFNLKSFSNLDAGKLESYPLERALLYNGADSKWTRALFLKQDKLIRYHKLKKVYAHLMRTAPTVAGIQNRGVLVCKKTLDRFDKRFSRQQREIEGQIADSKEVKMFERRLGKKFEATNNHHILALFKDVLGRKEISVKRKGQDIVTTDEAALATIPLKIAKLILEHRKVSKLLRTYVQGTRSLIFPDGRFHAAFNLLLTSTGRLSSDSPNMQNFPKRKDKYIRNQVIAPPGYVLLAADYGQIEARVIAMASEDEYFLDALWKGLDIHEYWARRILELHEDSYRRVVDEYGLDSNDEAKVVKTLRTEVKNGWVFPQFYGSAYYNCAKNMKLPVDIAEMMADEFWEMFSGVRRWQERTIKAYKQKGYVETLTGRRRHGPIHRGEIINTPIQGTASDLVVDAMNRLDMEGLCPNINVHDDLTQELPKDRLEKLARKVARIMCKPSFDFVTCPLVVEMEVAERWGELAPYKEFHSNRDFNHRRHE